MLCKWYAIKHLLNIYVLKIVSPFLGSESLFMKKIISQEHWDKYVTEDDPTVDSTTYLNFSIDTFIILFLS